MQYLISTDLDGTLLNHHDYRWDAAVDAINLCLDDQIPIVFNTSKTISEVSQLQLAIGIEGPTIVENGSALILPNNFFNLSLNIDYLTQIKLDGLMITHTASSIEIIFGERRAHLLKFIEQVREQKGWLFEGFNDWSTQEIIDQTGLSEAAAHAASDKFYSEPFIWKDTDLALQRFTEQAIKQGYMVLRGGRFYHLQGKTNKALPIMWLQQHVLPLYGANYCSDDVNSGKCQPELICLGDNQNDIDMLNIADYPVCIRSPVSDFPQLKTSKKVIYSEAEGPIGWGEAIQKLLKQ